MKVTLLSAIGIFWLACIAFVAWITAVQPKDDATEDAQSSPKPYQRRTFR